MPPKTLAQTVAAMSAAEPAEVSTILDDYSLREKIDIEVAVGATLGELYFSGRWSYRAMAALAWITKRRTTPSLTWDAFLDSGDENWTMVKPDPTGPDGSRGDEPERSPGSSEPIRDSA